MTNESTTPALSESEPPAAPRGNNFVWYFGAFMLIGLLALAWIGRPRRPNTVGEPMPIVDLQPLLVADRDFTNEDLNGKLTLFHFWGTWCPPCQLEFPEFAELVRQFSDNPKVQIVSVSCSQGPEYDLEALRVQTEQFLGEFELDIATYVDTTAMTRQQIALLLPNGSFGYPTTLLVGPDGKIISSLAGYLPGDMEKLGVRLESHL